MKTTVVNLKYEKGDINCGRPSKWGNPYIIGKDGDREEVLQKYKKYLFNDPDLIIEARKELKDKVLECYCKPLKCHCDLLAYLCDIKIYAVVGSRNFNSFDILENELNKYKIKLVVSGGCKGADILAKKYCEKYKIPIIEILPKWDKYGKRAGLIRNQKIIDLCDTCIAFWDGKSKGTKHDIDLCKTNNKELEIVYI